MIPVDELCISDLKYFLTKIEKIKPGHITFKSMSLVKASLQKFWKIVKVEEQIFEIKSWC